jgi:hypothetical protein
MPVSNSHLSLDNNNIDYSHISEVEATIYIAWALFLFLWLPGYWIIITN